jgi:hypothetical protein
MFVLLSACPGAHFPDSPSSGGGGRSAGGSERLYVLEGLHEPILLYFQVIVALKVQPETVAHPEVPGKA